MKCLLFIRTSTTRQEVESQLKETREYAESLGYDEFVTVGDKGRSAYKVTDEYLELIGEMKETINKDPEIKAVVCYHLNRLFRNITVANELKEWFVENKIQLEIREPHIKLLEADGTLSNSSEMVFYFFSVYSKQQIDELRAKTVRAKKRDMLLHKYIGGPVVKYGYRVNKDKFVEPDPEKAEIVKEIFDIYVNHCHSYPTATREINERHGMDFGEYHITHILNCPKYWDGTQYPPIITEEVYRQAEAIRKSHTMKDTQYRNRRFANRLITCPVCGKGYTANVRDYRCATKGCHGTMLSIPQLDGLLWRISSHLESEHLMRLDNMEEYAQKKAVLGDKIKSVDSYATKDKKSRERAKKCVVEGIITIEEYKERISELDNEYRKVEEKVGMWKAEIEEIDRLMSEDTGKAKRILEISDNITASDESQMRDIVRKWVKRIGIDGRDITVETVARVYRCVCRPYGKKYVWYTVNGNPLPVKPVNRAKGGKVWFGKCTVKPQDLATTLAWLGGSEIV